ncbi:hypothetical protein E2C01_086695 [Portunus trituberculatus]|uniref:Uncharacterized protein n=1 Tax=Portunus trituberculatus TaxID=210409 RepID=A0A5B7JH35_PORTR|nr:hypothetical protein [Portunus trituberculatus]
MKCGSSSPVTPRGSKRQTSERRAVASDVADTLPSPYPRITHAGTKRPNASKEKEEHEKKEEEGRGRRRMEEENGKEEEEKKKEEQEELQEKEEVE